MQSQWKGETNFRTRLWDRHVCQLLDRDHSHLNWGRPNYSKHFWYLHGEALRGTAADKILLFHPSPQGERLLTHQEGSSHHQWEVFKANIGRHSEQSIGPLLSLQLLMCTISVSPSSDLTNEVVSFKQLRVCRSPGTPSRSGQEAGEGCNGDCSWPGACFPQQAIFGGWRPVIDLLPLNTFVALSKFKLKTVMSFLDSIRKGDCVLSRSEGRILSDPQTSRIETIPAVHGEQKDPPVQILSFALSSAP